MTAATGTETGTAACPCGSGRPHAECCLPVIEGRAPARTAEACMRARYSAFALGKVDFIWDSHHSKTRDEVSKEAIQDWSRRAEWLGLEVLGTEAGGEGDEAGFVRFRARYREKGVIVDHLEDAHFEREGGAWRFVTGAQPPTKRESPKVGRNDPCPCGSGKKYKKCCGAQAA